MAPASLSGAYGTGGEAGKVGGGHVALGGGIAGRRGRAGSEVMGGLWWAVGGAVLPPASNRRTNQVERGGRLGRKARLGGLPCATRRLSQVVLGGEGLAQCLRGHRAAFGVQAWARMRARSQTTFTCEKERPETKVQAWFRSIDMIRNVSVTSTLRSALCAQPIDHCPFFSSL